MEKLSYCCLMIGDNNYILLDGVKYIVVDVQPISTLNKCDLCDLSFCRSRDLHNKIISCDPRSVCTLFGQQSGVSSWLIFKKV